MSARKTGEPSDAGAQRLGRQVDVDTAGKRESHDEGRRREVARTGERMDPALEVAVTGQDCGDDQVVRLDRGGDRLVERAGVADTGRAAISGQREAERLERGHEPGGLEIARHRLRTRCQRGLDRRSNAQPAGDRVPSQKPGPDHDRRVRRVGARRDRGDRHRPGPDGRTLPVDLDLDRPIGALVDRPARGDQVGRWGRFVRRVAAGERRGVARREGCRRCLLDQPVAFDRLLARQVGDRTVQAVREVRPEVVPQRRQRHSILRPARTRH